MTDPRIIALSSNPGQVEPGPFSEHDLREQWNAQADEFNRWESLDSSEQLAWAQTRAITSVQFASLMQEPAGPSLEEVGPLIAWLTETATQSANAGASKAAGMLTWAAQVVGQRVDEDAPDADQAEGPSLADVDELCAEFSFHYEDGDSLEILQEMITAAITRWSAPVAQAVATPPPPPRVGQILRLAEIIREADPADRIGGWAHQLAQALLKHPGFSGCHDGPAALPAQEAGEGLSDQEIIDLADFDAGFDRYDTTDESGNEGVAWECSNSQLLHFARLVRQDCPAALPAPDHVNLIGFAWGREPWATWLRQGGCLESAHCELSDLMLAVLAKWGRPAALPAPEAGETSELSDEYLVRVYQQAYEPALKRGEAFGCHWDGLRAVFNLGQKQTIAAIPKGTPALPAPGFQIGPQEYIPHA